MKYAQVLIILTFQGKTSSIQLGSTTEQLERIQILDEKIQEGISYLQDAYEQFNFKYLHPKENEQNKNILNLAQISNNEKLNLLFQKVDYDNQFVQMNEENKFFGSLLWKLVDFVTLGQLETKKPIVSKEDNKITSTIQNQKQSNQSIVIKYEKTEKEKINYQQKQKENTNQQNQKENTNLQKQKENTTRIANINSLNRKQEKNQSQKIIINKMNKQKIQDLQNSSVKQIQIFQQLVQKEEIQENNQIKQINQNNQKPIIDLNNRSIAQSDKQYNLEKQIPLNIKIQTNNSSRLNPQTIESASHQNNKNTSKILTQKQNQNTINNITSNQNITSNTLTVNKDFVREANQNQSLSNKIDNNLTISLFNQTINSKIQLNISQNEEQLTNSQQLTQKQHYHQHHKKHKKREHKSRHRNHNQQQIQESKQISQQQSNSLITEDEQKKIEKQQMVIKLGAKQAEENELFSKSKYNLHQIQNLNQQEIYDDIDPTIQYINKISLEHTSDEDQDLIKSTFQQFANDNNQGQIFMLSKEKTQLAYEKIFQIWNLDLTADQEMLFEKDRFENVWIKHAGSSEFSKLSVDKSLDFMKDLTGFTQQEKKIIQNAQKRRKRHHH